MIQYRSHPRRTPAWLTRAVVFLGGAIGIGIMAELIIALCGFAIFMMPMFVPDHPYNITIAEAVKFGVVGTLAAGTTIVAIMMAISMNGLKRSAISLNLYTLYGSLAVMMTVCMDFFGKAVYKYPYWLAVASVIGVIGVGLLPFVLLKTKAATKLYHRK